jgi:hypothetical protein
MAAPGPRRSAGGPGDDVGPASEGRVGGSVLETVMGASLGYAGSGSNSTTEPNFLHMTRLLHIRRGKSNRALVGRVRANKDGVTDEYESWNK